MSRKPFSVEEFREIYSRVPRLNAEVIIKTKEGIVLTFRTAFGWENMWHIPGGTVHMNEFLEDAVKRVAKEEVGAEVNIERLLGYIHYPSEKKERGFGWAVGISFLCSLKSEMKKVEGGDKVGIFNELPRNIIEEQKVFLEETKILEK
jgi:ADP-ribose pyrophosphatase YjhB (NUDIX family)